MISSIFSISCYYQPDNKLNEIMRYNFDNIFDGHTHHTQFGYYWSKWRHLIEEYIYNNNFEELKNIIVIGNIKIIFLLWLYFITL